MKIFTSSWSARLPPTIARIGISRGLPKFRTGQYRLLQALAPGPWFRSVSTEEYHRRYFAQLAGLDPRAIVDELRRLGAGRDVALLCFESPSDPQATCHRGYVSAWLADELALTVPEFGHENEGAGWSHPKIPARFRVPPPLPLFS